MEIKYKKRPVNGLFFLHYSSLFHCPLFFFPSCRQPDQTGRNNYKRSENSDIRDVQCCGTAFRIRRWTAVVGFDLLMV